MQLCYAKMYSPSSIKIGCPSERNIYTYMAKVIESILWVCVTSPHIKQKKAMGKMQAKKEKAKQYNKSTERYVTQKRGIYAKKLKLCVFYIF